MAIRTFLDANVLIEVHRGKEKKRCLAIINDRRRIFVASPFLQLEVIPKAVYYRQQLEIEFYKTYFDNVRIWVNDLEAIVSLARQESERCGLAALDALM
ncbi:MAG: nucleic acid-binding protein [Acidobacteria bacterium]|nr:nucleic acid-binding protein [Acidobacteriota bacterium]